ncbi:hypothetical protein [Vibrio furnissii]|uniref:hypothetical protein n=1 Tax=Vibrio furnissii TaxID=29494 RepID=UPI001F4F20FE|nr:hypothetical protein [Vibrio furnissii]
MKFLSADVVARHLPWTTLIDKLDDTFRTGSMPRRATITPLNVPTAKPPCC